MKRTREEAEITRKHLLDAAMLVFNRKGYSNASLDDVAAEAGVTRGAVYHHFGGKVELFEALVTERFERVNRLYKEILNGNETPLAKLRHLLVDMLALLEDDPEYRDLQSLLLFKVAFAPELENSMQQKVLNLRASLDVLSGLVRAGKKAGEFRGDLNPDDTALAAMGLLNGVSMHWLMDPADFSIRACAAGVVDTFLKGIQTSR